MPISFIRAIQNKVAVSAIGASTLRGQGTSGMVDAARQFLAELNLRRFSVSTEGYFRRRLDKETENLYTSFPRRGRSWGAARKALNIFLRDVFYNAYLHDAFDLAVAEPWFEVPLDSAVARGLKRHESDLESRLPRWPGVKWLTPLVSDEYQTYAASLASTMAIARVHLDVYLWVAER